MPKQFVLSLPTAIIGVLLLVAVVTIAVLTTMLMTRDDDHPSVAIIATATISPPMDSPAAVDSPVATASETPAPTELPVDPTTYGDAFAYCAAVGTIDSPDSRYSGPANPSPVALALEIAADLPRGVLTSPDSPAAIWRCMSGSAYGCYVGANLPCGAADTNRVPTEAMHETCRSIGFLSAADTGHATIYAWRCENGMAVAGEQIVDVDPRGFISQYWYQLHP